LESEDQPNCIRTEYKSFDSSLFWELVLSLIACGNLNAAYEEVLNAEDDVFLIRLVKLTGVCLDSLCTSTSKQLLLRLHQILCSGFLGLLG